MGDILSGKHIVLGISGGIAAYKSAMLLRLLVKRGAEVQVVMTPNAKEFITPVTLSSLSGKPVVSEFFTANTGEWHSHVDLGIWADLMIVAPATASTIAKMATGVADNMLVTTYLSAKEHVMVAPAMDLDMWAHPSTARNIQTLQDDGVEVIFPVSGELASHLTGKGRMQEPDIIVKHVENFFLNASVNDSNNNNQDLKGKKVLVTAGPTYEKIDPVRFIGNFSTGKMGFALAAEAAARGAEVTLVAGPVALETPSGIAERIDVESALEMHEEVMRRAAASDIIIFTAAVADFRPAQTSESKIKRGGMDVMNIELVKNPDIAADCGKNKLEGQKLVGFALETSDGLTNAREKLERKNLDMIVLNSLADPGAGFATDTNKVTLFTRTGHESYPLKDKHEVAADIFDAIINNL